MEDREEDASACEIAREFREDGTDGDDEEDDNELRSTDDEAKKRGHRAGEIRCLAENILCIRTRRNAASYAPRSRRQWPNQHLAT